MEPAAINARVSRDETHDSIDPHTGGLTMAAQAKRRAMAEALPNPNSMEPAPVEGASEPALPPVVSDAPPLHVSGEHPTLETL